MQGKDTKKRADTQQDQGNCQVCTLPNSILKETDNRSYPAIFLKAKLFLFLNLFLFLVDLLVENVHHLVQGGGKIIVLGGDVGHSSPPEIH